MEQSNLYSESRGEYMTPIPAEVAENPEALRSRILEMVKEGPVQRDKLVHQLSWEFFCYQNVVQDAIWELGVEEDYDSFLHPPRQCA